MTDREKLYQSNTTNLAYVGDAVYEVYVRRRLFEGPFANTKVLHKAAIRYVSAAGQAEALKAMFDDLTEEEQRLVKRARNHRSATKPKNADPVEYKWATAFEALLGYLYLAGEEERFLELAAKAWEINEQG
ncbi:MAG: ribonuclease III [Firmicutes bacterium]|nr:ribonuclease III [Bacillota bacterium]